MIDNKIDEMVETICPYICKIIGHDYINTHYFSNEKGKIEQIKVDKKTDCYRCNNVKIKTSEKYINKEMSR